MRTVNEFSQGVNIPAAGVTLEGDLNIPENAKGIVIFAHGSGSSRLSPRNRYVAEQIREAGLGTLLFDLLTPEEEAVDNYTRHLRFDIDLLSERLAAAARWLLNTPEGRAMPIGFFGSSTGGAAALKASVDVGSAAQAVVSRGGRPDLAGDALPKVKAPTLLIVGGYDDIVIELNRRAKDQMVCENELAIVPQATHLFEEPGALAEVARLAAEWFAAHLGGTGDARETTDPELAANAGGRK